VLEKLGEGGMGAVYRARDANLDREVALKVLPRHAVADPDAVARFQREAKALAKVGHANVIHAHDAGADRGRHFLVMEYAEGVNLAAVLRERGRLAPGLAADYARQAALGLQHAHERGLVHRDVKPGNLLLTRDGVVKLLDLGLARFLQDQVSDTGLTREGAGMGTPDYMAPEQFRDAHHADSRADVYSLGCTLFHLLTGRVPFPGSSLREKCRAHEEQQPPSFAEVCPEAPAGLALVVEKMMAKRPADRFQTAAEAAEALLPYVASSSASLPDLRTTVTFHRGQLTMKAVSPGARRVRRVLLGLSVATLGALSALGVAWLLDRAGPPAGTGPVALAPEAKGKGAAPTEKGDKEAGPPAKAPNGGKVEPAKPTVETIPNGLTVARDGTGQFKTIGEALGEVKPGQTIRVLDAAVYRESISLGRASQFAGVTLEAVRGATLEGSFPDGGNLVEVVGVPGVTLRGFRLRASGKGCTLALVKGKAHGVTLDRLTFATESGPKINGLEILSNAPSGGDAPLVVRGCSFTRLGPGLLIDGCGRGSGYAVAFLCERIVVRDNVFLDCELGLGIKGAARHVHVVGNRLVAARMIALQLENLLEGTEDILIANNTVFESPTALRYWDLRARGKDVRIRNNLVLGADGADMVFLDNGGIQDKVAGPGDGSALLRAWQWGQNWRETAGPPEGPDRAFWLPPAAEDVLKDMIPLRSRTVKDAGRFLRPAADSPLARGGAGGDLPSYVGAVPPEDGDAWDWQWTWDAHVNKLLTVSKDPKTGGRFRTITAALEQVKPGMTVRVLDGATYQENLLINSPTGHAGITLEATAGATLENKASPGWTVQVQGVPGVTVRGFTMRRSAAGKAVHTHVLVKSACPGVRLSRLELVGDRGGSCNGVEVLAAEQREGAPPLVIEDCVFRAPFVGVAVIGMALPAYRSAAPCSGVVVRNNTLLDPYVGITVAGAVKRIHVVGNKIKSAAAAGLQLENLLPGSGDVLLANNTILESEAAFRLWDDAVKGKAIALRNNLTLGSIKQDFLFVDSGGSPSQAKGVGDGAQVAHNPEWKLGHNWREVRRPTELSGQWKGWIPAGSKDVVKEQIEVLSRVASNPRFLRPGPDSPLATRGAGGDLPPYVGAVPPEGSVAWDWDRTWKARAAKSADNGDH
jgi:nitrous oxidase accessory protein NosD